MRRKQPLKGDLNLPALLSAFAIAMGYLEAVVVVYIRKILDIVPPPLDLTSQTLAQLPDWLITTEQSREAATIIMLVALAALVGRSWRQKLGPFLFTFGVWDIFYYVSLKALINWPATLTTQDCLFLIPQPWYAPVWVPVVISLGMIALGLLLLGGNQPPHHPRQPD